LLIASILFGLLALALSAILTCVMRRFAHKLGLIDVPREGRFSERPTPKGGGMAIFAGTVLSISAAYFWFAHDAGNPVGAELFRHSETILMVLLGGLVLVILGFLDDIKGLPVWFRLAVEFGVAAGLFFFTDDVQVTFFAPYAWMPVVFTSLWIVGITNSFNLLDNMDGLSAGVAFIVSGVLLWVAVTAEPPQYFLCVLLIGFMGSLLGFLLFNFPPASIFMGDSGSLFLGYFVAVLSTVCTFTTFGSGNVVAAALPLLMMAVPLYDSFSVVWIRVKNGVSIFQGDKNHLSHRLVGLGFTVRDAVLVIYLLTFCCGVGAALSGRLDSLGAALVVVQVGGFLLLTALLERAGRHALRKAKREGEDERVDE
jgi:UDP-GlcNAc:undecaprenyl-phosphate GlcNAc-1-phosphate transferase